MKHLLLFAVFTYYANALDSEELTKLLTKTAKVTKECRIITKAPFVDYQRVIVKKKPESYAGKCLMSCVLKKFNMQNADGKLNKEETLKLIKPFEDDTEYYNKFVEILDHCVDTTDYNQDPCLIAVDFTLCCSDKAKSLGIEESAFGDKAKFFY